MKIKKFDIQKIDFELLNKQKSILIDTINNDTVDPEHKEGLEGILLLIDDIQDYAVDVLKFSEDKVFNLTDEH